PASPEPHFPDPHRLYSMHTVRPTPPSTCSRRTCPPSHRRLHRQKLPDTHPSCQSLPRYGLVVSRNYHWLPVNRRRLSAGANFLQSPILTNLTLHHCHIAERLRGEIEMSHWSSDKSACMPGFFSHSLERQSSSGEPL